MVDAGLVALGLQRKGLDHGHRALLIDAVFPVECEEDLVEARYRPVAVAPHIGKVVFAYGALRASGKVRLKQEISYNGSLQRWWIGVRFRLQLPEASVGIKQDAADSQLPHVHCVQVPVGCPAW